MSDQDRISPYNIKTKSSRQVNITSAIISRSSPKFSQPTSKKLYGIARRITDEILGVRGLTCGCEYYSTTQDFH